MFMMHFMSASNTFCIPIISVSKEFKPLLDKNVVNCTISNSVSQNTKCNWQTVPNIFITPQIKTNHANNNIKNKKGIVAFQPTFMIFFVMVFMQVPQKTMHYIFMRKPSHKFHDGKSAEKNK